MNASLIYFLILFQYFVFRSAADRSDDAIGLVKYINAIGSTSHGRCLCEPCVECVCTINEIQYVTHASWASIAIQEFKGLDTKISVTYQWPKDLLDVSQTPGHPLLGSISGKLEPLLHLKRYPEKSVLTTTRFLLFDRFNFRLKSKAIHYNDRGVFETLPVYEQIFIVIHGWLGSVKDGPFIQMRNALINYNRYINPGVVMVDWKQGAGFNLKECLENDKISCVYEKAAANAILVGRQVTLICHLLINGGHINAHQIHIIGFSLGAQVAHFSANWFTSLQKGFHSEAGHQLIGRITALDPSARHFQGYKGAHVTKEDAIFVDVIHTSPVKDGGSAVDTLLGLFGMSISVGSVDFYPNRGQQQPDCPDVKGQDMTCNHMSALKYFIRSLLNNTDRKALMSIPCSSFNDLPTCSAQISSYGSLSLSYMGIDAQDYNGRGDHYLHFSEKVSRLKRNDGTGIACKDVEPSRAQAQTPPSVLHSDDHKLCGLYKRNHANSRVWKGKEAARGEFPWTVVFLYAIEDKDGNVVPKMMKGPFCTGSIISRRWVLTAAHCFEYVREHAYLYIMVGKTDVRSDYPGLTVRLKFHKHAHLPNYFPHPGYKNNILCENSENDIALIRLDVELVLPEGKYKNEDLNRICFHTMGKLDECDDYQFSGFGRIGEEKIPNYLLNKYGATRLTRYECKQLDTRNKITDYDKRWCGSNNSHPYPGFCSGDSGGPAVVYHEISHPGEEPLYRAVQVGVAVFSRECIDDRLQLVTITKNNKRKFVGRAPGDEFTNVAHYVDWIKQTMDDWHY